MIHFVFIAQHFPWSHLIEYSNTYMFAIAIGELMRFSLFYHLTLLGYPFQMDCSNECSMLTVLHILWQSRPKGFFFSLSYDLHTAGFFGFLIAKDFILFVIRGSQYLKVNNSIYIENYFHLKFQCQVEKVVMHFCLEFNVIRKNGQTPAESGS